MLLASAIALVTVKETGCWGAAEKEAAKVFIEAIEAAEEKYEDPFDKLVEGAVGVVTEHAPQISDEDIIVFRQKLIRRLEYQNNPVHKLMRKRLRDLWQDAISRTLGDLLLKGAEELSFKSEEWVVPLIRTADLNRRVHGRRLGQMMREGAVALLRRVPAVA